MELVKPDLTLNKAYYLSWRSNLRKSQFLICIIIQTSVIATIISSKSFGVQIYFIESCKLQFSYHNNSHHYSAWRITIFTLNYWVCEFDQKFMTMNQSIYLIFRHDLIDLFSKIQSKIYYRRLNLTIGFVLAKKTEASKGIVGYSESGDLVNTLIDSHFFASGTNYQVCKVEMSSVFAFYFFCSNENSGNVYMLI